VTTDYTPRLSVDISPELQLRLQNSIPWGLRKQLVITLVEGALDLIERDKTGAVLALIFQRALSAGDILRSGGKKDES
jgi:hypothetical protein